MDTQNRVALITGGKRIGRVVAQELARRGVDIALAYRGSKTDADLAAEDTRALGRKAVTIQADVAIPEQCATLVAETAKQLGRLDFLINMASIYVSKPFDELTREDFDTDIAINLKAAFFCAQAAIPHLRTAGGGRIVNFTDWVASSGRPTYHGFLPYYVAKAGIVALTEALAYELAGDQILVNAVAPGPILAPADSSAEEIAHVAKATPLGRWGGPLEIAKAVLALIDNDFITGETIRVDGGRHLR